MKKTILATTLLTAFVFCADAKSDAQDFDNPTTELVGFGGGVLTGAAVGGPVGAVVGGLIGIFIADDIKDEKIKAYQLTALQEADNDLHKKTELLASLQADMQRLETKSMMQLVNLRESQQASIHEKLSDFQSSIQFNTASSTIDESYRSQLSSLATLLQQFPDLSVSISGYADQRGDSAYNKSLSQERAKSVADFLLSNNVDPSQIHFTGLGEASQRDLSATSAENLFFDRRVNINILPKGQIMTAAK